jgi:hypothetical protein
MSNADVDTGETEVFCETGDADCFAAKINRSAKDVTAVPSLGMQFGHNARKAEEPRRKCPI